MTDICSKWVELFSLSIQTAEAVAECLVTVFLRFGLPTCLLTDLGKNFQSSLISQLLCRLGIKRLRTAPYRPQTNGQCERFNHTLATMLSTCTDETQHGWQQSLPFVAYAYNSSIHDATGFAPYKLMFGTEPRSLSSLELDEPLANPGQITYHEYIVKLESIIRETNQKASDRVNKQLIKRAHEPTNSGFQKGDLVMLKRHQFPVGKSAKLAFKYEGPFPIIDVRRPNYIIGRKKKSLLVHGENLKLYQRNAVVEVDEPIDSNDMQLH